MTINNKNQQEDVRVKNIIDNRELALFIANISQNIEDSGDGIFLNATVLHAIENDPQKKYCVGGIVSYATELIDYSSNLLDFAKVHLNLAPIIDQKFDLKRLIEKVIIRYRLAAKHNELKLTSNIVPDIPNILIGDIYRLRSILEILIANSIKFTQAGSIALTVNLVAEKSQIDENVNEDENDNDDKEVILQFIVYDTGIGISKERQEYIREQLASSGNERSILKSDLHSDSGLGLGFTLIRQFIHETNSKIELRSQEGKSTSFIVTIPLKVSGINDNFK